MKNLVITDSYGDEVVFEWLGWTLEFPRWRASDVWRMERGDTETTRPRAGGRVMHLPALDASQWADIGRNEMLGAPAPKENEMEPIERIANAAETYMAKATELEPLHTGFIMAQLNHMDRQFDPPTQEAMLRVVWDRAYFAALTGVSGSETTSSGPCDSGDAVEYAAAIADATADRWLAMTARRDALIRKAVES